MATVLLSCFKFVLSNHTFLLDLKILKIEQGNDMKVVNTHASLSNRLLRQMLIAVCLTRVPRVRLLTTIPSTRGIATDILTQHDAVLTLYISQRQNVTTYKVAKQSHTQISHQCGDCQSSNWGSKKSKKEHHVLAAKLFTALMAWPSGKVSASSSSAINSHAGQIFSLVDATKPTVP